MNSLQTDIETLAKSLEDAYEEETEQDAFTILGYCRRYKKEEPKLEALVRLALTKFPDHYKPDENYFMCEGMQKILKVTGMDPSKPLQAVVHFISYYILDDGELIIHPVIVQTVYGDSYDRKVELEIDTSSIDFPQRSEEIYKNLEIYGKLSLEVWKENDEKFKEIFGDDDLNC